MIKIINFIKRKYSIELLDIVFYLVLSFSFTLPINQKTSTFVLLFTAFTLMFKLKAFNLKIFASFFPIIALYLLYAYAYYRDDYIFGVYMFEKKASLLLFPVIFSVVNFDKEKLIKILKAFVLGCILFYCISLLRSFYNSITLSPLEFNFIIEKFRNTTTNLSPLLINNFLGHNFAFNMQKSYLAIYFLLALSVIWYYDKFIKIKSLRIVIIGLLICGVFQVFSLIAFICLIFIMLFTLNSNLSKKLVYIFSSIFFIGIIVLSITDNSNKIESNITTKKLQVYDNRTTIWPVALRQINKSFFFGYGVKSAQKTLEQNYPKVGEFGYASQTKKLDTHNTFIQITLEMGLLGLLLFVKIIYDYYKIICKTKEDFKILKIANIFFFLFILLSFVESTLNVYAGISFFFFFYCLFFSYFKQRELNHQK